MLFSQQLLVRCIPVEDDSMLQLFRQLSGSLLITFDKLNAVIFFQLMGQTRANIAPADQHNTLIRLFQSLQFAHDRANMLRGGNKEDFISGLDNRRTLRADGAIVAENGGHARIDMRHMLPHSG